METEENQLRRQLYEVEYELKNTKAKLDKEQKESKETYKKNVDSLNKYIDESNNQRSNAQFYMKKSKDLEEKFHAFAITFEEPDPST